MPVSAVGVLLAPCIDKSNLRAHYQKSLKLKEEYFCFEIMVSVIQ